MAGLNLTKIPPSNEAKQTGDLKSKIRDLRRTPLHASSDDGGAKYTVTPE
jgi:hypothetical protein